MRRMRRPGRGALRGMVRAAPRPGPSLAVAIALLFGGVVGLGGQEGADAVPLTKSDLTRIVVGTTYGPEEVVRIVRRSCLSFDPTERDLEDLRRLGAEEAVLEAVRDCATRPALMASVSRSTIDATTGNIVRLDVELRRGEEPASGVRVVLAGSGRLPGGTEGDLSQVTDARGRATFRIPAGSREGRYALRLATPGERLEGQTGLLLAVRPAPPPAGPALAEADGAAPAAEPEDAEDAAADEGASAEAGDVAGTDDADEAAGTEPDDEALEDLARDTLRPRGGERPAWVDSIALDRGTPAERVEPETIERAEARGEDDRDEAGRDVEGADDAGRVARTEAEERFRARLDRDDRAEAEAGEAGDAPESELDRLRRATAEDPQDGEAWLALGRALAAAEHPGEARAAFRRAVAADSSLRPEAEAQLALLPRLPPTVELSVYGGASFERGSTSGLLHGQIAVRPLAPLQVWARYDGGLGMTLPALIRGRGEPRTVAGGARVEWGEASRYVTIVEAGRREDEAGLLQFTYRAEQRLPLEEGANRPTLAVGAFLGRWFDRDDWLLHAGLDVPVTPFVAVRPGLSFGETVGTAFAEHGRRAAREARAEVSVAMRPIPELTLVPTLAVGQVEDREEDESGTLREGRFLLEATLGEGVRFLTFLRHQRPAFSEAFTSIAAGLRLALDDLDGS